MQSRDYQRLRLLSLMINARSTGWKNLPDRAKRTALRTIAKIQSELLAPAQTAGCQ
jgi:hypothetical protein